MALIDVFTPMALGLHLATAHFGAPAKLDLQSTTPGVYLRSEAGLTIGAFRNSVARNSAYAAWTWSTRDEVWSITAGGVTGYPNKSISPLLVPSVRLQFGEGFSWATRVSYLPKADRHGAHGLHLSLERRMAP